MAREDTTATHDWVPRLQNLVHVPVPDVLINCAAKLLHTAAVTMVLITIQWAVGWRLNDDGVGI